MLKRIKFFFVVILGLGGCVSYMHHMPDDFTYREIPAGEYKIATWSRITSKTDPVHIYIEGDGHAFNMRGTPTSNPTPRGGAMRRMATRDASPNVVYMARPCQFVMTDACTTSDWTDGRFSPRIIRAMTSAVRSVSGTRPVVLIGYSGGAMASGLIIQTNSGIKIREWITVAGVLNHRAWTTHFGDASLTKSMDMIDLPDVPQKHYIAANDTVVPNELTRATASADTIIVVENAGHDDLDMFEIEFRD